MNLADGLTSNNGFQTGAYSARCVRGGPTDGTDSADPPPDLYAVSSGEVHDRWTGHTFPDTRADDWYWSVTPYANNAANRWCLNHNDGYTTRGRAATELSYVRCVR